MFRLILITDLKMVGGEEILLEKIMAVAKALPQGLVAIQVREKEMPARALCELVLKIKSHIEGMAIPIFVNDRVDIALCAHADGVHLPSNGLPPKDVKKIFSGMIGKSTHSLSEVTSTSEVDYLTFGPIFDTPSKRPYGAPHGEEILHRVVEQSKVPIFAIGGIREGRASLLRGTGIMGIAVVSAILSARNPADVAINLLKEVNLI